MMGRIGRFLLSLRGRVLLWIAAVQIALMLILGALFVTEARDLIRVEQRAAQDAARALVLSTLGSMLAEDGAVRAGQLMPALAERLVAPRHIRLRFFDARARELPVARSGAAARAAAALRPPPGWFRAWMRPPVKVIRIPVATARSTQGVVLIEPDPEDDIARFWRQLTRLIALSLLGVGGLMLVLYGVIGRALAPLARLRAALADLAGGHLSARVPPVPGPDLAPMAGQVNHLAASLEEADSARQDLTRRLTDLQEAERKQLALELHDEMGPCLFGLSAEVDMIARKAGPELRPHADAIAAILDQLRQTSRRVLGALRPMTVGQLPLADVLRDLVAAQDALYPRIAIRAGITPLPATDEALDLTLYRFVQEAVTNAARHAGTDRISIDIRADEDCIIAVLRDYGVGPTDLRPGTGLRGMRERIRASGGTLSIDPAPGGGTKLTATLPVRMP